MQKKLIVAPSPFLRNEKASTRSIMLDVIIALLPTALAAVWFFGTPALSVMLVCVLGCVGFEWAYQKMTHQPSTIGDLSAVVTGLLLAFNMPASAPWWMGLVGAAIAIVLVKQMFGGIGQNFINPALAARTILMLSWTVLMAANVLPQAGQVFGLDPNTFKGGSTVAVVQTVSTESTSEATGAATGEAAAPVATMVAEATTEATGTATGEAAAPAATMVAEATTEATAAATGEAADPAATVAAEATTEATGAATGEAAAPAATPVAAEAITEATGAATGEAAAPVATMVAETTTEPTGAATGEAPAPVATVVAETTTEATGAATGEAAAPVATPVAAETAEATTEATGAATGEAAAPAATPVAAEATTEATGAATGEAAAPAAETAETAEATTEATGAATGEAAAPAATVAAEATTEATGAATGEAAATAAAEATTEATGAATETTASATSEATSSSTAAVETVASATSTTVEATSVATPLNASVQPGDYTLWDLFSGNIPGMLGETCKLTLLLGGLYLIFRRVIDWRIPVSFIVTAFILFWIKTGVIYSPESGSQNALYQLLSGGLVLGAFFMATDYVTSPISKLGRVIMGIGCAVILFVIRFFNAGYPEGCSFAILFMNVLTPLIDRYTARKPFGYTKPPKAAKEGAANA